MATTSPDRILSLDVIRGIAVMGIFSVNVVGMAMLQDAYFYPPAFGFDTLADKAMWLANFLLIDGKLRALFSIIAMPTMLTERMPMTAMPRITSSERMRSGEVVAICSP